MTRLTPSQLRQMAVQYDAGAEEYTFDIRISKALWHAADDAEMAAKYRHVGIKYLRWLDVKDPDTGIEQDINDPEMVGDLDTARRTQEKQT